MTERRRGSNRGPGLPWRAGFWGGIRGRLLRSYLLLMLLVMVALSALILAGLEAYYRNAMADVLQTRGTAGQQYFSRLEPGLDLALAGQDLARELGAQAPYRVQVFTNDGRLVGDSTLPAAPGPAVVTPADVTAVLQARAPRETVSRSEGGSRALHLTMPLGLANGLTAGALRFSTSLAALDALLYRAGLVLLLVTLALLALTAGVGNVLARTVVQPVTELTRVASAIAGGELGLRARVYYPDEVGRLAETLNRMAQRLGEVDRLRSEFLRAVSHDLRTPLAAIKAWAVTLQDDEMTSEDLHSGLTAVEDSADHLARLVEDLLVAARLQAGVDLALRPQWADAAQVVAAVRTALLPRARAGSVDLNGPEPAALPPVWFDPDRLTQVTVNLVENAIKFTPPGGSVNVALRAEPGAVVLSVADNGMGIEAADLPRVTAPFFRGQGAAAVPGTGLGLAIVSAILERSGGRLSIQSEPGGGTTAVARLPVSVSAAAGEVAQ